MVVVVGAVSTGYTASRSKKNPRVVVVASVVEVDVVVVLNRRGDGLRPSGKDGVDRFPGPHPVIPEHCMGQADQEHEHQETHTGRPTPGSDPGVGGGPDPDEGNEEVDNDQSKQEIRIEEPANHHEPALDQSHGDSGGDHDKRRTHQGSPDTSPPHAPLPPAGHRR